MIKFSKPPIVIGAVVGTVVAGHITASNETRYREEKALANVKRELYQEKERADQVKKEVKSVLDDYVDQGNVYYLMEKIFDNFQEVEARSKWIRENNYYVPFSYFESHPFSLTKPTWTTQDLRTQDFVTVHVTADIATSRIYPAESVRNFILQAFPKRWNAQLVEFSQKPETTDMSKEYGIDSTAEMTTRTTREKEKDAIVTIKSNLIPVVHDSKALTGTLSHEICHVNGWEDAQTVGLEERFTLVKNLLGRISASNRFYSSYVEDIQVVDGDEPKYYFHKISEYWAEICSQWFEDESELPLEDYVIVSDWISLFDSGYNLAQYQTAQRGFLSAGVEKPLETVTDSLSENEKKDIRIKIQLRQKILQFLQGE